MSKISERSAEAFMSGENFALHNTSVTVDEGGVTSLMLHGNKIAIRNYDGSIAIRHAGWATNVTKSRLNALPNVQIKQIKGQWYLNGHPWDGRWVTISEGDKVQTTLPI